MGFTGLQPKTAWLDCEWSAATWKQATGKSLLRTITEDTRESLRILTDLFPNVGVYTRGNWWDENIREHGWEKDYRFWIAHYPMWWRTGNAWRQALDFEELEVELPDPRREWPNIGAFIPKENVIGWQFSDHGRLPGYGKNLDLDLWIPPPKPTLEQAVADHELRIVALEEA
jgi:GH25 family lysozyme M1 (1,4-beta-N-acetylmuramidase)